MTIPDDIRQWRKERRAELLSRRVAVTADLHRKWNDAITELLLEGFPVLQRLVVGCYWPFQGEFDPRFVIRRLREGGARAALPVVVKKNAPLEFREWWPGARIRMTGGAIDLPIPEGTEVLKPGALIIPPIGFDSRGYRLGYGGGYFDRTLAATVPHPLKIGVAFELSRVPTIHPQPHDVPMDFIVTEAGIHYVSEDGLELIPDRSKVIELAADIARERDLVARGGHDQTLRQARSRTRAAAQHSSPPCYTH